MLLFSVSVRNIIYAVKMGDARSETEIFIYQWFIVGTYGSKKRQS